MRQSMSVEVAERMKQERIAEAEKLRAAAERELTVRADPAMVYQFRALARNAAGISAPGGASPPTMVNRFHAALLEPPSAVATESWDATAVPPARSISRTT